MLGQPFEERTAAQNLSFHGCRYASKHHLPKNTWITLEVPSGGSRGDAACVRARVAWIQRPQTLRDLFQVGVELEKGKNVWGVTPPSDWNSGSVLTMTASFTPPREGEEASLERAERDTSLEVYLQMALAHANRDFTAVVEEEANVVSENNPLIEELRREFVFESQRTIAKACEVAGEIAEQKLTELRGDIERKQEASAEAFQKKWMEAFVQGKVDAKAEILSALTESVSAQLASFQDQVHDALAKEWAEKLSHSNVDAQEWQSEVQALRGEIRAAAEVNGKHSEERLDEKLRDIRSDLEASQVASLAVVTAESLESVKARLLSETDTARAQWSELLESSLDSAAQRFNERLTSTSQELLHRTQQKLAERVSELQNESGSAVETSRVALSELKGKLEAEVSRAKAALGEIEQTAGRFSEYSRQLEAASQDGLNELRQRLESNVVRQSAELDRHAVELEEQFTSRAGELLERMSRETVERSAQEIGAHTAAGLERANRAAEELAAREQQAEGILRIHRERLRQVSEQVQKEGAAYLTSELATLREDLESVRGQMLTQWKTEFEANGVRATENASAALAKETARQLVEADAQLLVQAQQAIDSAQERMHKGVHVIAGKFRSELDEIEAGQLGVAREKLEAAALEHLDSTKNEFTRAAERAASTFGEVIAETSDGALRNFSAASEARAEDGRARLRAGVENALQKVQSSAQTSFEHFQEQLATKSDQALKRVSDVLDYQFEVVLEKLRMQGEAQLADWSEKLTLANEQALEKHDERLRLASHSRMEATLEQLDGRSEEHIDAAVRATENSVRRACADIFDSVAQAMKKQMQGALELRPAVPGAETNPQEQRASA